MVQLGYRSIHRDRPASIRYGRDVGGRDLGALPTQEEIASLAGVRPATAEKGVADTWLGYCGIVVVDMERLRPRRNGPPTGNRESVPVPSWRAPLLETCVVERLILSLGTLRLDQLFRSVSVAVGAGSRSAPAADRRGPGPGSGADAVPPERGLPDACRGNQVVMNEFTAAVDTSGGVIGIGNDW